MTVEWYLAELVMKITVADDPRNVVHQNLVLIKANSPDDAYEKAINLGKNEESSYTNPYGKVVQFTFEGLSGLDLIDEELGDGAELTFRSKVGVSDDQLHLMVLPRDRLHAFLPPMEAEGPNYASGDILALLKRDYGINRADGPDPGDTDPSAK